MTAPDRFATLAAYFRSSEGAAYAGAIEAADALIDGFQSPLGMEVLATVDWLLDRHQAEPTLVGIRQALSQWPTPGAAARKQKVFSDDLLQAALDRLTAPLR